MNYNDYLLGNKKGKKVSLISEQSIEETITNLSANQQTEINNSPLGLAKASTIVVEGGNLTVEKTPTELTMSIPLSSKKEPKDLIGNVVGSALAGQALGALGLLARDTLSGLSRDLRNAIFDTKYESKMFGSSEPVNVIPKDLGVKKEPIDKISNETINPTGRSIEVDKAPVVDEYVSTEKDISNETINPTGRSIEVENNTPIDKKNESKAVKVDLGNLRFTNGSSDLGIEQLNKYRPSLDSLGYISVIPQGEVDGFVIPFEFVPEIKEGSYSAQYNAHSILARIGSLQNYSHTELSTPSITTNYYVFSKDGSASNSSYGHSWMSHYTLEKVQAIQRMYESLVLPKFPKDEQTSIDNPFSYLRPPFVKIMIGGEDSTLFVYPELLGGDLKSQKNNRRHKLFLVTGVNVEKNLKETPLILKDGGKIIDTFGFSVTIDLLEVTKSYMDIYPDYNTYFKSFETIVNGATTATPAS